LFVFANLGPLAFKGHQAYKFNPGHELKHGLKRYSSSAAAGFETNVRSGDGYENIISYLGPLIGVRVVNS